MKNILVTTTTFPNFLENDSTPPFVYELSRRLGEKKDLNIIVSTPYVKNSKGYEEKDNLKIYRFKYGFTALRDGAILPNIKKNKLLIFQLPFFLLFSFLNLVKLVRKENINIIHAHWIIPQGFFAVFYKKVFRKKGLKIICTVHGGDIFSLRNKIFTKVKKWTLDNVDVVTVVSNEIKEEVIRIGVKNKNIKIMPMGVDDNLFSLEKRNDEIRKKYDANNFLVLFVGRLVEKKGVEYAISSMDLVFKKHSNVKFLIIGDGPLKEKIEEKINIYNLKKNIILLGGIPNCDLPKYYATADLFLAPSVTAKNGDSEGFGLVLVEAMLSGCPVIASDLRAMSDIVKNNINGIQLDVKDTKLFANKIIELIEDKEKRLALAKNGYDFVKENFTWEISTDNYYNLIKDL